MIYLVDIGNTRLKYITFDKKYKETPYEKPIISSHAISVMANEVSECWLNSNWGNATKIIIASVNQKSQIEMIQLWSKNLAISVDVINSSKQAHGVETGYRFYEQLGVDRWLALIGAHHYYKNKDVIIIDSGTATTVDVLKANGQHLGGWIIPGVDLMKQSIIVGTANVISDDLEPSLELGDKTVSNVSNGCWAATLGLIALAKEQLIQCNDELEASIVEQVSSEPLLIFTGGNGEYLYQLNIKSSSLHNNGLISNIELNQRIESQCFEPELIFYGLIQYI